MNIKNVMCDHQTVYQKCDVIDDFCAGCEQNIEFFVDLHCN